MSSEAARVLAFAHMLMQVSDVERSRQFYVDTLGFTVRAAKPLADGRPFIPFHQGLALTSGCVAGSPQIDHVAFEVTDVRALDARCRAAGVRYVQALHDGIYGLTIYVSDPDGTTIELYQPGARLG